MSGSRIDFGNQKCLVAVATKTRIVTVLGDEISALVFFGEKQSDSLESMAITLKT